MIIWTSLNYDFYWITASSSKVKEEARLHARISYCAFALID